ncbi:MAG: response regulator transcription factor [Steroidobacteraceae bacterium]|nr:response regulator transcription factor [Steroidobacteraceae bacterium]
MKTARTTVALVEDHPVVRDGLSLLLAEQPDFKVVGEAEDVEGALALVERVRPQAVVLDVTLRGRNALSLIPELRQRWPALRILILSMHEESLYAERLLALGAHGYVMKQEPPAEFLRALRRVAAGELHVSTAVGERLVARARRAPRALAGGAEERLTGREREVLRLVARGLGTQEISRELAMSPKTVDSHRRNIREKLGLSNARDLVRYAVRWAADRPAEGGE